MTGALVGAVWLTQSLRYIDFVMARGLSILSFFKLILFLLPNLIAIVLPFSFFISLLFILNKFDNDRELIVFQSIGLSNVELTKPVLKLATIICLIVYGLNFYFYPLANQYYRSSKNEIINNVTASILSPGEFTTFKKMTFYIKEKINSQYVTGLLVYDQRNPQRPVSIVAEKAQIVELKNGLRLILINGNRQEVDRSGQLNLVSFEIYSLDLINNATVIDKEPKPGEYFITQLLNPPSNIGTKTSAKLRFEGHQRLLLPLIIFPFTLLALWVFLTGKFNRRGRYQKIGFALLGALSIEILTITCLNLSRKYTALLPLSYSVLAVLCMILMIALFKNQWRNYPHERSTL